MKRKLKKVLWLTLTAIEWFLKHFQTCLFWVLMIGNAGICLYRLPEIGVEYALIFFLFGWLLIHVFVRASEWGIRVIVINK